MKSKIFYLLFLPVLFIQCGKTDDIIQENVTHAEKQLAYLIAASEEGGTLKIPSTFKNGEIEFVPTDDWVSGFFAGTLWYMYELTGNEMYAEKAQKHTELLHDIQFLKWHHDVGFMVYDSYGNGLRLKNIPGYDTVLVNTAKSLSTRFRPAVGILQSWNVINNGWQSERGWKCPVIIDNMMNLELLFKVSEMTGDDTYKNIAISHADKTLENHYRDDFSTYHVVDYDDETGEIRRKCTAQGIADESRWARGQGWSIYGFTVAYRFTGDERYLQRAKDVANYLLVEEDNMPEDLVPLWDFDVVQYANDADEMIELFGDKDAMLPYTETRDASSAAIIASALYELYWYTKDNFYKEKADKMIESLSSPAYRAEVGENGGFLLMHSVGSLPHSVINIRTNPNAHNIDVPLNYADYYFLEALIRKGRVEKGENPIK
ncbi:MAG: glycoside hydrolase family 88 protein [Candidatus Cryptobacteroides sp.]